MNFDTFLDGFHSSRIALPPEESTLYVMDAFSGACLSGKLKENFGKGSLSTTPLFFFTVNHYDYNQTVNFKSGLPFPFLRQLILCDEKNCRGWFPPPGWGKNLEPRCDLPGLPKSPLEATMFPFRNSSAEGSGSHLSPQVCVSTKFVRKTIPQEKTPTDFHREIQGFFLLFWVMSWCPEFAKLATGSGNQTYTVDGWNWQKTTWDLRNTTFLRI